MVSGGDQNAAMGRTVRRLFMVPPWVVHMTCSLQSVQPAFRRKGYDGNHIPLTQLKSKSIRQAIEVTNYETAGGGGVARAFRARGAWFSVFAVWLSVSGLVFLVLDPGARRFPRTKPKDRMA